MIDLEKILTLVFLPFVCIAGLFIFALLSILLGSVISDLRDEYKERKKKNGKEK